MVPYVYGLRVGGGSVRLIDRSISYIKWRTGWGGLTYYRTVKINNKALRVPLFRGVGYDNLTNPESYLDGIFKRILMSESGAVLDVGANIGYFSLIWLTAFRERGSWAPFKTCRPSGRGRFICTQRMTPPHTS